jgi:hypothetical protein
VPGAIALSARARLQLGHLRPGLLVLGDRLSTTLPSLAIERDQDRVDDLGDLHREIELRLVGATESSPCFFAAGVILTSDGAPVLMNSS